MRRRLNSELTFGKWGARSIDNMLVEPHPPSRRPETLPIPGSYPCATSVNMNPRVSEIHVRPLCGQPRTAHSYQKE